MTKIMSAIIWRDTYMNNIFFRNRISFQHLTWYRTLACTFVCMEHIYELVTEPECNKLVGTFRSIHIDNAVELTSLLCPIFATFLTLGDCTFHERT